jgi:ADP-ribosylation factor-like protein 13B
MVPSETESGSSRSKKTAVAAVTHSSFISPSGAMSSPRPSSALSPRAAGGTTTTPSAIPGVPKKDFNYGVKAIRQLRNTNSAKQFHQPRPNLQRQQIIEKTYDYFLREVDPIIGDCVTYLLCKQPENVPLTMLEYLTQLQKGNKLQPNSSSEENEKSPMKMMDKKPSKTQKLFLATQISPILSKIVNRIATQRPVDVIGFICQELQSFMQSLDEDERTLPSHSKGKSIAGDMKTNKASSSAASSGPKNIQILVLGNGGAGKTSFINALQGKFDTNVRPTIGFRPTNMLMGEDKVKFYDLGGSVKIRGIWPEYFHDIHGIIYLVDSSVKGNEEASLESVQLFKDTLSHSTLRDKPLLLVANKQDAPGALSADDIRELYALETLLPTSPYHVAETSSSCLSSSADEPEVIEQEADPRVEKSVEWLLTQIQENYSELHQRVEADSKVKQLEEQQKRLLKERKVLKNKIMAAFADQVDPTLLLEGMTAANPEDVYTKEEGEVFLANEIGEELASLPPIALEIAGLIGYQRLALQMVGAFKAPISKKKTPMSWEEIRALVMELRSELGL